MKTIPDTEILVNVFSNSREVVVQLTHSPTGITSIPVKGKSQYLCKKEALKDLESKFADWEKIKSREGIENGFKKSTEARQQEGEEKGKGL